MTIEQIEEIYGYELEKPIQLTVIARNPGDDDMTAKALETEDPYAICAFEDDEIFAFTEYTNFYQILLFIKRDDHRVKDHDFVPYRQWKEVPG